MEASAKEEKLLILLSVELKREIGSQLEKRRGEGRGRGVGGDERRRGGEAS